MIRSKIRMSTAVMIMVVGLYLKVAQAVDLTPQRPGKHTAVGNCGRFRRIFHQSLEIGAATLGLRSHVGLVVEETHLMKRLLTLARLVVLVPSTTTFLGISSASAEQNANVAQVAGEWTRCVAWSGGTTFNIVNGQANREQCFALGRKCTGNPNATITFYGNPVIVNAPYTRCATL